jgi:hypothetical protein
LDSEISFALIIIFAMDKIYTNITYDGYLIKKEVKALEILNIEDNI